MLLHNLEIEERHYFIHVDIHFLTFFCLFFIEFWTWIVSLKKENNTHRFSLRTSTIYSYSFWTDHMNITLEVSLYVLCDSLREINSQNTKYKLNMWNPSCLIPRDFEISSLKNSQVSTAKFVRFEADGIRLVAPPYTKLCSYG